MVANLLAPSHKPNRVARVVGATGVSGRVGREWLENERKGVFQKEDTCGSGAEPAGQLSEPRSLEAASYIVVAACCYCCTQSRFKLLIGIQCCQPASDSVASELNFAPSLLASDGSLSLAPRGDAIERLTVRQRPIKALPCVRNRAVSAHPSRGLFLFSPTRYRHQKWRQ